MGRLVETFLVFLKLGLTSFGGPVAHIGYLHDEFVTRRKWLDDAAYADLVAFCQFLPGPASSQVAIAIGDMRGGLPGAVLAWLAFTLPSVLMLAGFAAGSSLWAGPAAQGLLHGLMLAAAAVVALAALQMAQRLTPDWPRRAVALVAALLVIALPFAATPVVVLAIALGLGALRGGAAPAVGSATSPHPLATVALATFAALLAGLPVLNAITDNGIVDVADRFYRAGSLVFGGGHVVLPLLESELVDTGMVDRDMFLAGYGAAQAVPGPLFSFAWYAGALLKGPPNGWVGGALALAAIYLPSFLLVLGGLPFWAMLRQQPRLRSGLDVANAAVVGLVLAALWDPIISGTIHNWIDAVLVAIAFAALLRVPPWAVVLACGGVGLVLA
ncbi:MAG: chromate efflux transporter [Devosia sp.]